MQDQCRILVVDGDIHLGKFLKRKLADNNYRVDLRTDGSGVVDELHNNRYDLVILELNLPGMDGMELLKRIHAAQSRPRILVLTARSATADVVGGLSEGADDYLTKPFSFLELMARVRVLLSPRHRAPTSVTPVAEELVVDRNGYRVVRGDRKIDLTLREFELLECMAANKGKALSRKTLMEEVWKADYDPDTNIVDVYVKYLRDKIDVTGEKKLIRTVRGVGYVFGDGRESSSGRAESAA